MPRKKPIVLCILDGWGLSAEEKYNAIAQANTPNFDEIWEKYPHSTLNASGLYVGLPEGQMGNSEVGHMNIGAGRVIFQNLPKINKSIQENTLKNNETVQKALNELKKSKGDLHLLGLLSDGGVHSHIKHIIALAKIFAEANINVKVHAFLDGRDTPQKSALTYIEQFQNETKDYENISIATVGGRYFGMDRDKRWERVEQAYNVITMGAEINTIPDALEAVNSAYKKAVTDEFIEPVAINDYQGMQDGDGFIFANFRSDRARELSTALADPNFVSFERKKVVDFVAKVQMTEYSAKHNEYLDTIFPPETIKNSLGEVISEQGLAQLRTAETEKYAHVTFFFNGGTEAKFKGEERLLVNSPKVATYDLQPEMSAPEVTTNLVKAIKSGKYDFIVVNYANLDMVGHTGIMQATMKACEEVDKDLGEVIKAVKEQDGIIFVTADHGNAEKMYDEAEGQPYTAHTTNKVPFVLVGNDVSKFKLADGSLSNIAPTILDIMEIQKPREMTEASVLER